MHRFGCTRLGTCERGCRRWQAARLGRAVQRSAAIAICACFKSLNASLSARQVRPCRRSIAVEQLSRPQPSAPARIHLQQAFDAARELMPRPDPPKRPIGFVTPEDEFGRSIEAWRQSAQTAYLPSCRHDPEEEIHLHRTTLSLPETPSTARAIRTRPRQSTRYLLGQCLHAHT